MWIGPLTVQLQGPPAGDVLIPPSPVPRPRLLERGMAPKFARIGVHHEGSGGLWEHAYHQGYNPASIIAAVRKLL